MLESDPRGRRSGQRFGVVSSREHNIKLYSRGEDVIRPTSTIPYRKSCTGFDDAEVGTEQRSDFHMFDLRRAGLHDGEE